MSRPQDYAAIVLGDSSVSVLVASNHSVRQHRYEIEVTMEAGVLACLASVPPPEPTPWSVDRSATDSERYPWAHIDDDLILIGSAPIPAAQVFGGTIAEALERSGVDGPVDLLEIVCPSLWGRGRQRTLRTAATHLAREVVTYDLSTVAVRSRGERAPTVGVVVEVGEFASIVSTVSAAGALPAGEPRAELVYERSGRWDAVGAVDLLTPDADTAARASIAQRVSECAAATKSDDVEVFVVRSSSAAVTVGFPGDDDRRGPRLHRLDESDLLAFMAAGIGLSEPVIDRESDLLWGPPEPLRAVEPERRPELEREELRPARAAAWLDEATAAPPSDRPVAMVAIGAALAAALAVIVGVVVVRMMSEPSISAPSVPVAKPSRSVEAATTPVLGAESGPGSTESIESDVPAVTVEPEPPSRTSRFDVGRASVELPATWSARIEPTRVLLVPADLPERRIVVETVELRPGTTFDDVADDLQGALLARGEDSAIGSFVRATDFGGRTGISYLESPGDSSVVRWRIVVDDDLQVSVGCQSAEGSEEALAQDCEHAVSSLVVTANE